MNYTLGKPIVIAISIVSTILAIAGPVVYYNLEQERAMFAAIQKQVDAGVDPIKARCSIEKDGVQLPICAIAASK